MKRLHMPNNSVLFEPYPPGTYHSIKRLLNSINQIEIEPLVFEPALWLNTVLVYSENAFIYSQALEMYFTELLVEARELCQPESVLFAEFNYEKYKQNARLVMILSEPIEEKYGDVGLTLLEPLSGSVPELSPELVSLYCAAYSVRNFQEMVTDAIVELDWAVEYTFRHMNAPKKAKPVKKVRFQDSML